MHVNFSPSSSNRKITLDGTSTTLRPDALSVDHQTAFTLGPVREGDSSHGLVSWVWRVRHEAGSVYLCRENELRDNWEDETLLFSYDGPEIVELDVAFEQSGQAVVCAERHTGPDNSSEVWIFFYDATVPGYVFQSFGGGRTPKTALDRPVEIADSDVCVFYINPADACLCYRQQRDRYQVPILTSAPAGENTFVEDVVRTGDRRVVVIYSVRDPVSGTYSLHRLASKLPPYGMELEAISADQALTLAEITRMFYWLDAEMEPEAVTAAQMLTSALIRSVIMDLNLEVEALTATSALSSVVLYALIIQVVMRAEALTAARVFTSVANILTITIDRALEIEAVTAARTLTSVELVAA